MDKNMLRGVFGTTAAAAPAAPAAPKKSYQDVYDTEYKKLLGKGMSPKAAAAFAKNIAKRVAG